MEISRHRHHPGRDDLRQTRLPKASGEPVPNIRLVFDDAANSTTPSPLYATALHRDALGTVRAVTGISTDTTKQGKMTERSVFRP